MGLSMMFSRFSRRLDKLRGWKKDVAVGLLVGLLLAVGGGLASGAYWVYGQFRPIQTVQGQARIRILNVHAVPMAASGAPFPAINIYYDNAGTLAAFGVVSRWAVGFGNGRLSNEVMLAEQDKLLQWNGWESAMAARQRYEMQPGDPGEFTTIPNVEGVLAEDFRANFDKAASGTSVLHVFITFKYRDRAMPSNTVGVTEDCFWFSGGGFARHNCGRGRTLLEQRP